jgi:hypothetical protein
LAAPVENFELTSDKSEKRFDRGGWVLERVFARRDCAEVVEDRCPAGPKQLPRERHVDEDVECGVRGIDVHEVELLRLVDQVRQNAPRLADELAYPCSIDKRDVAVEGFFELRCLDAVRVVAGNPRERVDAGDVRVAQPPEQKARGETFEGAEFEKLRRPAVEAAHDGLPRGNVHREPVFTEGSAPDDLSVEPRRESVVGHRPPCRAAGRWRCGLRLRPSEARGKEARMEPPPPARFKRR